MIGNKSGIRTGIDLGATSVKLVRGAGHGRLADITHLGIEPIRDSAGPRDAQAAGAALRALLERLGLKRNQLGRIAVAASGPEIACREVAMASLDEATIARALPFEARKHLDLDNMHAPVLDYQVLGPVVGQDEGPNRMRVLFAATPRAVRDFPVNALRVAGLEPDVVDLEPLAVLNALEGSGAAAGAGEQALGVLDLGGDRACLHLWSPLGGLLTREVATAADAGGQSAWNGGLTAAVRETVVFFRGRFRRDVGHVHLCGGGALKPGLDAQLAEALGINVTVFDPLRGLATGSADAASRAEGPRLAIACGLCRWWDTIN